MSAALPRAAWRSRPPPRASLSAVLRPLPPQAVELHFGNPDFDYAARHDVPRYTLGAFRTCLETLFARSTGAFGPWDWLCGGSCSPHPLLPPCTTPTSHPPLLTPTGRAQGASWSVGCTGSRRTTFSRLRRRSCCERMRAWSRSSWWATTPRATLWARTRGVESATAARRALPAAARTHRASHSRRLRPAGRPAHRWRSVLVRTGCFRGEGNDKEHPAWRVYDCALDAVTDILRQHNN